MLNRYDRAKPQSRQPTGRARAITRPEPGSFSFRILYMLLALLLVLLMQAVFAGHVSAHSELVDSQPADGALLDHAPERVVTTFSEELESSLSELHVFDAQGTQVDNGDGGVDLDDLDHLTMVVSLPPLTAGTYTVHWAAVSADDDDETKGAFTFTIGSSDIGPESAAQPAGSNSNLTIGAIVVGVLLLATLVVFYTRQRQKAPVET